MGAPDRLLVVDDDRVHCMQLESVLSSLGFTVQTTHDAVSAMEAIATERPSAVVCDAEMPEMDGWTLVRHVRGDPELALLPLFLMLEKPDAGARVRAFQVGADACFVKPLDYEELAAQLRRKLTHQTQVLQRYAAPRGRRPNRRTTSLVLSGKIEKMGLGSVLSVLGMEERSGSLRVHGSGTRQGRVSFFKGQVQSAEVTGATPATGAPAVYAMLSWTEGRFIFRDDRDTQLDGGPLLKVQELLLEAARRSDEGERAPTP